MGFVYFFFLFIQLIVSLGMYVETYELVVLLNV